MKFSRSLMVLLCAATLHAEDVFMTLTRTAQPTRLLPTTAESVKPAQSDRWSAQTAGDAVSRLTSVQIQPAGGLGSVQTIKIRGSSTNQNLVLIDGRPVGGVSFPSSQDLSEVPAEQIERIEIVRGGVSALYGPNAMGGVVNVVTRRAPADGTPAASAGYELGSYGRNIFRGSYGQKLGALDFHLSGNKQNESGFRHNSNASTLNAAGNAGYSLGRAGRISLDASLYQADIGIPGRFFPAIPTNAFNNDIERRAVSPNASQETDTRAMQARYDVGLPANTNLTLRGWGSDRRVLYTDTDSFVDTDRLEMSRGGEAQLNLPYGLLVGGSFIHDREDSSDRATPANSFTRFVENTAFFAQETFQYRGITLIPSGRYDHHSEFGWTGNPRVQLMIDPADGIRYSGSAARSFRAPTIDELYYPFTDFGFGFSYEGNPNLLPEKAWTYDTGLEFYKPFGSLKLTYFNADVRNLIQTTLDPASTVINVGSARRQGGEVQLEHRIADPFRHSLNYTYLENRGTPPGYAEKVDLRYSPRHTVNYLATITPLKGLDWDHTLRYVDARWSGNDRSGTKLGSMLLWDMRLAWTVKRWGAYLQVRDVTNRRYEEQAGFPLAGRTFIGGVRWTL